MHDKTVGQLVQERFTNPVVGDRIQIGDIEFTVREMRDERIIKIGLKLQARRIN